METSEDFDMFRRVEEFIQRVHDSDYIIAEKASEIKYSMPREGVAQIAGRKPTGNLADKLAWAMSAYDEVKGSPELRKRFAYTCLDWINRAFAWHVIKEGKGLVRKLKECQNKNSKLESDLTDLTTKMLTLKGRCDELEKQREEWDDWKNRR